MQRLTIGFRNCTPVGGYLAAAARPDQPDDLRTQKAALCAGRFDAVLAELHRRLEPATTPEADAPGVVAPTAISPTAGTNSTIPPRSRAAFRSARA